MAKKKALPLLILLLLLVIVFFLGKKGLARYSKNNLSASEQKASAAPVKKEINQALSIELKNREKIKIKYLVESAELLREIMVKGEKVRASKDRAFLVFNLKIVNESQHGLQINSRDFIRLSSAGSEEWLAPEIHNDPVEVQAIAIKHARLGFSVNNEKRFKVRIGEIGGEKKGFELNF